jgi:hypothetical protein
MSSDGFSPNAIGLRQRPVSIEAAHEIRGGSRLIDRAARSSHPPLPHSRNRKRQLPFQEQLGEANKPTKEKSRNLTSA